LDRRHTLLVDDVDGVQLVGCHEGGDHVVRSSLGKG
jgi:hypothetical protein